MNPFLKTIPVVLFSIMLSCNTNKKAMENEHVSNTNKSATTMENSKNNNSKLTNGIIITGKKEGQCSFLIQLDDNTLLDPINLEKEYMIADLKIAFNFSQLRMMNRCDNANPISIIDIKKRAE